jgi:hypothetical protein
LPEGELRRRPQSHVLRHAWGGAPRVCSAAKDYSDQLHRPREPEASTLADLTGWKLEDIRRTDFQSDSLV